MAAELRPYTDGVERDRLGSVTGIKRGEQTPPGDRERRKVMLAAHMDEIGAVVTIIDRGVVRFSRVGGLDGRVLMGQEVLVHAGEICPVHRSVSPHLLPPDQPNNSCGGKDLQSTWACRR